ncbi:N2227-like protein [Cryptosporidium felis]|nr:N2227-like protein [Cryptosporidium felis]
MSDIENYSDCEKMNELVFYDGNDEDIFRYLLHFRNNFPLSSRDPENDTEEMKQVLEHDFNHFMNVITSFLLYEWDSIKDVARIERSLHSLSPQDRELLQITDIDGEINRLRTCISNNQDFLKLMLSPDLYYGKTIPEDEDFRNLSPKDLRDYLFDDYHLESKNTSEHCNSAISHQFPHSRMDKNTETNPCKGTLSDLPRTTVNNLQKVKATLRQFVRDWSDQGKVEREESFEPMIRALKEYLPLNQDASSRKLRVLVPGAGLGRLLFEVARLGYSCQGNEISYAMLLGSNFALNYAFKTNSLVIHPYVLSLSNRPMKEDNLRPIYLPDICVNDFIKPGHDLSMCAGDFVEVYSKQFQAWDGILTCFFLDTAKNIITYIRTIANILPPEGVWINLGPLLYHFSGMSNIISIEPSWEEIKVIISKYFEIVKEEWRDASYTRNTHSMFRIVYKCIFFVAIRNQEEFK